jgi:DNA-binding transcriptional ArsR family regulator
MTNAQQLWTACADPTRRAVLEALRSGPRSVGEIAADFPVTRSAISQHLTVLKEAGLVTARREGTRRVYRIDPDGLSDLRAWFDRFWDDALTAFADHAAKAPSTPPDRKGSIR